MYKNSLIITLILLIIIASGGFSYASVEKEIPSAKAEENDMLKGSASVINIKSDELEYFQERDEFIATGNVVINIENQGTVIKSDRVIYNRPNEEIISEENVEIIKNGTTVYGDYARFDLTTDSALIGSPDARMRQIKINAKTAKVYPEKIDAFTGKATLDQEDMMLVLSTGAVGGSRNKKIFQKRPDVESRFYYDIKAKEVIVEEKEYRNLITLKHAAISINKFQIARIPSLTLNTDKEVQRIETTLPEFGHLKELGSYLGYGFVFNTPKGSTLKALPLFTFGDGENSSVGFGGMGRFMSSTNKTEVFYSTLKDKVVFLGEQELFSPKTKLQYSSFAYIENGFFGRQKPAYLVELVDDRTLFTAYNHKFGLRSSAGMVERAEGNFATGRFQLQGTLVNIKPFWAYKENLSVGFGSNFSMVAYGTGNTYGVVRAGPHLAASAGRFTLWSAYYQGGIYGESPFLFDQYRYGKSNVMAKTTAQITDYLTVGYFVSLNLTRDNWEKDLVTENRIFFWIGPEDLKFKIGYDVERARTVFGVDMLVGSETSALEFEKLRVIPKD